MLISRYFGQPLKDRILSIALPLSPCQDIRIWGPSSSTSAPLSDLYSIYHLSQQGTDQVGWIWALPVHLRICLFFWKVMRRRLPTRSFLSSREVHIPLSRPFCDDLEESLDHTLFLCLRARCVWTQAGYSALLYTGDDAVGTFIRTLHSFLASRSLLAYLAYHLWITQNAMIFTFKTCSPIFIMERARAQAEKYHGSRVTSPEI